MNNLGGYTINIQFSSLLKSIDKLNMDNLFVMRQGMIQNIRQLKLNLLKAADNVERDKSYSMMIDYGATDKLAKIIIQGYKMAQQNVVSKTLVNDYNNAIDQIKKHYTKHKLSHKYVNHYSDEHVKNVLGHSLNKYIRGQIATQKIINKLITPKSGEKTNSGLQKYHGIDIQQTWFQSNYFIHSVNINNTLRAFIPLSILIAVLQQYTTSQSINFKYTNSGINYDYLKSINPQEVIYVYNSDGFKHIIESDNVFHNI